MKAVIILVVAAFCFSAVSAEGCQFDPVGHQNLDFSKYHGKWYLMETGPLNNQAGPLDCIYESYTQTTSPVVYNLNWHGQTQVGEVVDDTGLVTLPDLNRTSTLDFYIDGTVFKSLVVATDYETWALEYSCNFDIGWERFLLRSRTPELNPVVRQTLHHVINSYGTNVTDFAVVKHVNCV